MSDIVVNNVYCRFLVFGRVFIYNNCVLMKLDLYIFCNRENCQFHSIYW